MPFYRFSPRPFTATSVRKHAPTESGVYGISNAREWIYIGETDNLQETLLGHLRQWDTPLLRKKPTGFILELCERENRPARQDRLVVEYGPTCNRNGSRNP
jgi:hypothetical protein